MTTIALQSIEGKTIDQVTLEEWLIWRNTGIGSSDSAILCGCSTHKTEFELWLEKTGQIAPDKSNRAMRYGLIFEPAIAQIYEFEYGRKLKKGRLLRSSIDPWALCSLDYETENDDRNVELKMWNAFASNQLGEEGTDQAVEAHLIQVQKQMFVSGHTMTDLFYLVGGAECKLFTIKRDDAFIAELREIEKRFWKSVEELRQPQINLDDLATAIAVVKKSPITTSIPKELTEEIHSELLSAYQDSQAACKAAKAAKEIIEAKIVAAMDGSEYADFADGTRIHRAHIFVDEYDNHVDAYDYYRLYTSKPKQLSEPKKRLKQISKRRNEIE